MKKLIAILTMSFFLMVPTYSLAEGMEGAQTPDKDSSVKSGKSVKKTSSIKKKVAKKVKHAKKKAKKPVMQHESGKDMGTMPAHP